MRIGDRRTYSGHQVCLIGLRRNFRCSAFRNGRADSETYAQQRQNYPRHETSRLASVDGHCRLPLLDQ